MLVRMARSGYSQNACADSLDHDTSLTNAWNRFRTERNASADRRTTFGLRVDGKVSLHQLQPLLNAVETKPFDFPCRFEVKAHATIADRQLNLIRCCSQSSIELPHTAMLHRIVQASCSTRNRQSEISGDMALGKPLLLKSIPTLSRRQTLCRSSS